MNSLFAWEHRGNVTRLELEPYGRYTFSKNLFSSISYSSEYFILFGNHSEVTVSENCFDTVVSLDPSNATLGSFPGIELSDEAVIESNFPFQQDECLICDSLQACRSQDCATDIEAICSTGTEPPAPPPPPPPSPSTVWVPPVVDGADALPFPTESVDMVKVTKSFLANLNQLDPSGTILLQLTLGLHQFRLGTSC